MEKVFYPRSVVVDPILPPERAEVLSIMKKRGCVADGFLSGFGSVNHNIALVNRSACQYLHRAVETWRVVPDFDTVSEIQSKVTRDDLIYGMFLAEALDTKSEYYSVAFKRNFDFSRMCRKGSKNFWGEHTCKPSFKRPEYRAYLKQITEEAIDHNVTVFMFGQVFYQERSALNNPIVPEIIAEMREYAAFSGKTIVIGAQTNDITNEHYLRLYDFIEGGVGLHSDGSIEKNNACFSRWYKKPGDWCWALLWNNQFKTKANNVFVHLDWSGKLGDDMSRFTMLSQNKRAQILEDLYSFFTSQDVGFLMPLMAILPPQHSGCFGSEKGFYSADDLYGCKDEKVINKILLKK